MSRVVVALIAFALFAFASCIERTEPELREMYDQWAKKYNRYYTMSSIRSVKYEAFKQNIKQIDEHNSKKDKTYELGVNEYADMTWSEFQTHFRLNEPQHCSATGAKPFVSNSEPPKAVDWRTKNAVSAVKSQGRCGSCWTFSTTGALESHAFLKTGKMHDLSEQQLVDCAGDFDNHGCSGGLPSHAFEYVHYAGGIQNETTYNYKAVDGKCVFNKDLVVVKAQGSHNITVGDEDSMVKAIAEVGPVSIAYQVASDFRFYKKGVYNSVVCKSGPLDVNHAVLAVGYDVTAEGLPYWIVKNSWGTSFGLDGYFHIVRGKNMCGLAVCSSYPLLE